MKRTIFHGGGAPTTFAPPRASFERIKVRGDDDRTIFEVYEPRYFVETAEPQPEPPPRPQTRRPARPGGLVTLVQRQPLPIIGALFVVVVLLSATVTALAIALAAGG